MSSLMTNGGGVVRTEAEIEPCRIHHFGIKNTEKYKYLK